MPTAMAVSSGPTHTSRNRWVPAPPRPVGSSSMVLPSRDITTIGSPGSSQHDTPTAMNPLPRGATASRDRVPAPPIGASDSRGWLASSSATASAISSGVLSLSANPSITSSGTRTVSAAMRVHSLPSGEVHTRPSGDSSVPAERLVAMPRSSNPTATNPPS